MTSCVSCESQIPQASKPVHNMACFTCWSHCLQAILVKRTHSLQQNYQLAIHCNCELLLL